jgi:hypothetical protein
MKTKNLVLTAMAVFVAATVFATQLPTMNVIPVQNEKALVAFETMSPANFELTLTNRKGEVLYYKKSDEIVQNHRMVFDLHELEDGNYTVRLKHGNCILTRELTLSNHSSIKVGEEIRMFSPYYKFENNKLQLSYLNNAQKNVFVNIFKNGNYVTGKNLGKEMCIQKVLDFSKLEKGTYEVVLNNQSEEYLFTVQK